ncbi:cobyrinate a,c-diamide synthase [Selenihalanaerobacter shriftii]|uniref:Cobyrinate a,c-diamide synthase n=1 Tax=Selenihalanaerobacter shriftii TaxID=142842 RepID=A0A1T4K4K7_9FIRM|nr:cobyrinate a,c-diamide synthase [Selenihalanaerobacter shriftii]SJZ37283.1 cobyrinic acid a,c-diamide synthase [Selenihalanaerobacter shriftii]
MTQPRILIAGTQSGVGKTTLTIGLMAAMKKKGYKVQPYKVGPDYIDPGFHTIATGRVSRNLDSWMIPEERLIEIFLRNSQGADLSIIEGVMGLFDGHRKEEGKGSSADVAKILSTPVILVIDAKKLAQSGAALAYGYQNYNSDLNLIGVILNRVGSASHYQMIKEPIEELGISVLGYIPNQQQLELPERHLGLVPTAETPLLDDYIDELAEVILKYLDLNQLYELATETNDLELGEENLFIDQKSKTDIKLAVARDEAFNFYYEDNLELLESRGVKIEYFSPVNDERLPENIDGLYIGGGFPESFLEELSNNHSMRENIKKMIELGIPTYAECGGLMYLTEKIINFDGKEYEMVKVIPGVTAMQDRLQAMGYVKANVEVDNILLSKGQDIRGHEFHHSKLSDLPKDYEAAYTLTGGKGADGRLEGYVEDDLLATYLHLHFANNPRVVDNFIQKCEEFSGGVIYDEE